MLHCFIESIFELVLNASLNQFYIALTLSLTALGPISPISLKYQMLKKSLSEIKAILHLFLY
jgi:hypothetical protein